MHGVPILRQRSTGVSCALRPLGVEAMYEVGMNKAGDEVLFTVPPIKVACTVFRVLAASAKADGKAVELTSVDIDENVPMSSSAPLQPRSQQAGGAHPDIFHDLPRSRPANEGAGAIPLLDSVYRMLKGANSDEAAELLERLQLSGKHYGGVSSQVAQRYEAIKAKKTEIELVMRAREMELDALREQDSKLNREAAEMQEDAQEQLQAEATAKEVARAEAKAKQEREMRIIQIQAEAKAKEEAQAKAKAKQEQEMRMQEDAQEQLQAEATAKEVALAEAKATMETEEQVMEKRQQEQAELHNQKELRRQLQLRAAEHRMFPRVSLEDSTAAASVAAASNVHGVDQHEMIPQMAEEQTQAAELQSSPQAGGGEKTPEAPTCGGESPRGGEKTPPGSRVTELREEHLMLKILELEGQLRQQDVAKNPQYLQSSASKHSDRSNSPAPTEAPDLVGLVSSALNP